MTSKMQVQRSMACCAVLEDGADLEEVDKDTRYRNLQQKLAAGVQCCTATLLFWLLTSVVHSLYSVGTGAGLCAPGGRGSPAGLPHADRAARHEAAGQAEALQPPQRIHGEACTAPWCLLYSTILHFTGN